MYLRNADDKITLEVTTTPTTPLQWTADYKVFDRVFRRVVDVGVNLGALANTTPVDVLEIGDLENKCLILQSLTVFNADNATRTVQVKITDGTVTSRKATIELEEGYSLVIDNNDIRVLTETGRIISGPVETP